MTCTRAFKSGDSQAVRNPVELTYADMGQDLSISRLGDIIVITPVRRSLKDAVRLPREFPKPPAIEEREKIKLPERADA